jgi:hypothetical protein
MENLQSYNDFIKEGIFTSNFKDIIKKLYDYILTMDLKDITRDKDDFTFSIKRRNKIDPYDEEDWGQYPDKKDILVKIRKTWMRRNRVMIELGIDRYELYINTDKVDATNLEIRKLYKLLEKRFHDKYMEEDKLRKKRKEERIKSIDL